MFDSFGFEVIVQPALYLAAAISVLVVWFKGSHRPTTVEDGETRKGKRQLAVGARKRALLTLAGAAIVLPALVITPPGHRAAIYNLGGGVSPVERPEGLSFVVPWVQSARMVKVRTQVYVVDVFPQTDDLQEVTVPVAVNYHVEPDQAAELYQKVGLNYQAEVIAEAMPHLVTQEIGQFNAEDFPRNRARIAENVLKSLGERLGGYGIVVEAIYVKDAIFSDQFVQDNANKVSADLKAAEAERLVAVAEAEAQAVRVRAAGDRDAAIVKAEGERAAVEQVAAALGFTPAEYLEWVELNKWDGKLPSTLLGGDVPVIIDAAVAAE